MEKDIENMKKAIKFIAKTVAFSEARSNTANERTDGQFEQQVIHYIRMVDEILNK